MSQVSFELVAINSRTGVQIHMEQQELEALGWIVFVLSASGQVTFHRPFCPACKEKATRVFWLLVKREILEQELPI